MEAFWKTIEELFTKDLSTSPLETALFLFAIFGFFIALYIIYKIHQKKEQKRLLKVRENKWHELIHTYNLTENEVAFLDKLAMTLRLPDKKYLLIADHNTFHHALKEYGKHERADAGLVKSIIKKTNMQQAKEIITEIPTQRRRSKRIKVDITASLSAAGNTASTHGKNTSTQNARMFDLSRGGCRVENPEMGYKPGDDVKMSFQYKEKIYRDIPAAVVKTSSGKKVLHLSFGHVKKS